MAVAREDCHNRAMTVAYLCVSALLVLAIATVRHQRPAISVPAVILLLSTAGWNLTRVLRGPDDSDPSTLAALSILSVEVSSVAFFVMCRRLVHGRWRVPAWMWIAMVWFTTLVFVGMLPAVGITTGGVYDESPVFVAHLAYSFGFLGGGILVLSVRQHDQSRHVRRFVAATEASALLLVTFQVVLPALTSLAAAVIALLAAWTTRHAGAWSRSASRADRLLDTIGVFIFVVDRKGVLQDWNGPAASLLELNGTQARRGLDLARTLRLPPFIDGATVDVEIEHGTLRMALSVHEVDPLRLNSDQVLMFRPTRSSVESSSFPTVSGSLKGHDPATQTLGRKAALELLEQAVEAGTPILRFVALPRSDRRPDDLMFLLARRLESRAHEEGWEDEYELARLDTWTFVGPLFEPDRAVEGHARYDDLGIEIDLTVLRPGPHETLAEFTRRVSATDTGGAAPMRSRR